MSLPSDFHSLWRVQEWLRRMRDECASVAAVYAKGAPSWRGRASEAFDDYRHKARGRWYVTADAFEDAHDAVERYLCTLAEVSRLRSYADAEQVERLDRQLAEEERVAVATVDRAAEQLWSVRSLLPERVVAAKPPAQPEKKSFVAQERVETVVATAAIKARYPRWQRQS